jgi:hypothetical protein
MQGRTNTVQNIVKRYTILSNGCWRWNGATARGYGRVRLKSSFEMAHRIFYKYFKGEIPQGLELHHKCEFKNCVNPEHLEAVTHRVNILSSDTPALRNILKTHCPFGHLYDVDNTYYGNKKGDRNCKLCKGIRKRNIRKYLRTGIRTYR